MNYKTAVMKALKRGIAISGAAARLLIGLGSVAMLVVGAFKRKKSKRT
jgi:sulfite exporter TauE/SafE